MELSIDTSTRYAGAGLSEEGRLLAEYSWVSRQNHSVELLPAIDHLLKTNGATPKDLTCVFVAIGPGGFSALRVGLSTAKGLAVSLGIPLVALNTLKIEADPFRSLGLPVCAALDAGRNEVAAAVYTEEDGVLKTARDAWIAAPEEVCSSIEGASPLLRRGIVASGDGAGGAPGRRGRACRAYAAHTEAWHSGPYGLRATAQGGAGRRIYTGAVLPQKAVHIDAATPGVTNHF